MAEGAGLMPGGGNRQREGWGGFLWLTLAAAATAYCGACAWLSMPLWEMAFRSDNSSVSWLSGALLFAIACLSLRLGLAHDLPAGLAAWLAVAIFWLALDEQFMLHEQWKFGCRAYFSPCRWESWGMAVRELPMVLVGAVGLLTAWRLHRHLPWRQRAGLWTAMAVGIFALAIDQLETLADFALFEEGVEVLSESMFLGILLGVGLSPPSSAA